MWVCPNHHFAKIGCHLYFPNIPYIYIYICAYIYIHIDLYAIHTHINMYIIYTQQFCCHDPSEHRGEKPRLRLPRRCWEMSIPGNTAAGRTATVDHGISGDSSAKFLSHWTYMTHIDIRYLHICIHISIT